MRDWVRGGPGRSLNGLPAQSSLPPSGGFVPVAGDCGCGVAGGGLRFARHRTCGARRGSRWWTPGRSPTRTALGMRRCGRPAGSAGARLVRHEQHRVGPAAVAVRPRTDRRRGVHAVDRRRIADGRPLRPCRHVLAAAADPERVRAAAPDLLHAGIGRGAGKQPARVDIQRRTRHPRAMTQRAAGAAQMPIVMRSPGDAAQFSPAASGSFDHREPVGAAGWAGGLFAREAVAGRHDGGGGCWRWPGSVRRWCRRCRRAVASRAGTVAAVRWASTLGSLPGSARLEGARSCGCSGAFRMRRGRGVAGGGGTRGPGCRATSRPFAHTAAS